MKKTVSVIDLGTTKVVCLTGIKTDDGYKVIASGQAPSQGIMRGEVVNNQTVLETLVPLLEELQEKTGVPVEEAVVGIAGQYVRCKSVSSHFNRADAGRQISEEEIYSMWLSMYNSRVNPGEEVLHVVPQSYHVDEYRGLTNPIGTFGSTIEANYKIFIGKSVSAEHTKRAIESAGVHLKKLVLEPLATAEAVLADDEKELGVAMVDIGGGTTDILVYHDNIVRHTAVIPFGGNIITEDIRQGCQVTMRQAEQMKHQFGSCYIDLAPDNTAIVLPGIGGREPREISFKFLSHIIEARMDEILDAVLYEIQQSGYADRLAAGIVLTGGGSLLGDLVPFIKFKTGMEARIARPRGVISDDSGQINHVTYSCAVGMLIHAFEAVDHFSANRQPTLDEIFAEVTAEKPKTAGKTGRSAAPKKAQSDKVIIGNLFSSISKFFKESDNQA